MDSKTASCATMSTDVTCDPSVRCHESRVVESDQSVDSSNMVLWDEAVTSHCNVGSIICLPTSLRELVTFTRAIYVSQ